MSENYAPIQEIKLKIESEFPVYWQKIFRIALDPPQMPNGIRVVVDNKKEIKALKETLVKWETDIKKESQQIQEVFDLSLFNPKNPEAYSAQEFKDDVFSKELWTVSEALRSRNPELDQYKRSYRSVSPKELMVFISNLLDDTKKFMASDAHNVRFNQIRDVSDLKLDYLLDDGMLLTGVVGRGIRSELLYRLYPSHFCIMTRRSLWGMYYLSKESDEFVHDEEEQGLHRTVTDWEYDYNQFMFYNNFICNLMEAYLSKSGINIQQSLRFGYVNHFLNRIYDEHRNKEIRYLTTWR